MKEKDKNEEPISRVKPRGYPLSPVNWRSPDDKDIRYQGINNKKSVGDGRLTECMTAMYWG